MPANMRFTTTIPVIDALSVLRLDVDPATQALCINGYYGANELSVVKTTDETGPYRSSIPTRSSARFAKNDDSETTTARSIRCSRIMFMTIADAWHGS